MNNIFTHLLALSGLLALLLLYSLWRKSSQNHKVTSAPEPSGAWPVIGHLHLLGGRVPVYRILGLADRYGPVFTVRLGVHTALVVSSWEAVKDCFTTNDKILNKRPAASAGKYLGYNYAAFGFTHGTYWRQMRKLVLLEVLSARRLERLKHVWESEINTGIKELYTKHSGKVVVISEWMEQLTLNNCDDDSWKKDTQIACKGHIKSMKRISKELSTVFQSWITEHVRSDRKSSFGNEQDFIDVMLSAIDEKFTRFGHTRETIIEATALNLILAGSDTTSIHLTWLLSLLLNNRQVMQQAQEEIDRKVGKERWVQESDINNLVYLQAIVKETLRLFPPGPLAVPHEAMEDCCVAGYHVPKGTRLLVNVWKLHRDPRIWAEPDNFVPERFLTSHVAVDFTGQNHEFIPFGSGRRSCPGITFAMQVTHLTLARLLQGFYWATPSNGPVDMTEGLSITLPKATPLEVVITPRLADGLYQY
ncbi:Xanthotoxin 5-hydroxylase CYP82C4 [Sesamum angolense]|uniref:Flavonoid-6-hydroxylase n=1 Tax=Sesamum angolense TaxID=2727404 RepID=A0AAE1XBB2_9LAMI|nr:Xanthotoxin 5-hydroxylase CYP82C4 [Sesamum angolense]